VRIPPARWTIGLSLQLPLPLGPQAGMSSAAGGGKKAKKAGKEAQKGVGSLVDAGEPLLGSMSDDAASPSSSSAAVAPIAPLGSGAPAASDSSVDPTPSPVSEDDGSSAEELAARRLLVQSLEGTLAPDQAAFAQAVQQAEQTKAQLIARMQPAAQSNSASPPPRSSDASPALGAGDVPTAAMMRVARPPSLARQPSAPEIRDIRPRRESNAGSSPPRDSRVPDAASSTSSQHTHHVSFSTIPSSVERGGAPAASGGVGSILTASPAMGPRHQSLPDLTLLGGADDFALDDEGGAPSEHQTAAPVPPAPFNHLAQRPSSEMFGGGARRPSAAGLPPRKNSNSMRQPLLSVDASSEATHVQLDSSGFPSGSPNSATASAHEQQLKEERSVEIADKSKGLGRRQLRAMLMKNWILKRRNPGQFLCELLSPLVMIMVIVGGWMFSLGHVHFQIDMKFADDTATVEEVFAWVQQHIVDIPTNQSHQSLDAALWGTSVTLTPISQPSRLHDGFDRDGTSDVVLDHAVLLDELQPRRAFRRSHATRRQLSRALLEDVSDVAALVADEESTDTAELDEEERAFGDLSFFSALRDDDNYFPFVDQVQRHSQRQGQGKARFADPTSPAATRQIDHERTHQSRGNVPSSLGSSQTCFPIQSLPGKQFCYDSGDGQSALERMLAFNGPMGVPNFDVFVSAHLVLKYLLANSTSIFSNMDQPIDVDQLDQFTNGRLANIIFLGKLMFAPDTPQVRQLVHRLNQTYALFNQTFTSIEESEATALQRSKAHLRTDTDRTWAIVVFNTLDLAGGALDFTIRMNSSVLPTTHSTIDRFVQGVDEDYKKYYYSGFLTLQTMIENVALNASAGAAFTTEHGFGVGGLGAADPTVPLNPNFTLSDSITGIPFPTLGYKSNPFYNTVGPLVGLVFCMSMLYPTSRLIKGMVEEKESRTKETMKMMGLKDWVFHSSWFITFLAQFIITLTGVVLLLHFTLMPRSDFSLLWLLFVMFGLSEIALGFLMTVFFSKAKLAGILGPILLFAFTMPRYAFYSSDASSDTSTTFAAKSVVSVLAPTVFTFGADLLMQYEGAMLGFRWSNLTDDPFSMARVMAFLLGDFVLYAVLAWYLDHVMPNEYGQRLSAFFCCKRSYWHDSQPDDDDGEEDAPTSTSDKTLVEPMPSSMHSKARVRIKKLRKVFTEGRGSDKRVTTAVHGLDLTLYEGQITALLGHNGAGKTTTISMLTGLISPSGGDCSMHGYSVLRNMKEIRKSLGVCPQINVLFSKLTCAEHLRLYGTLKGVKDEELEEEVARKIEEVGLKDKKDIYSSALSGGMQRKLQCAMAFIGGSKVVFLDEPTSGMDPYSRRSTWDLLRNAKKGRVIVLTTHFMDEADLLGDRIAIMSEGRLRCVGSSLFLKAKYGVGYNLTLVKASKACRIDQVTKMVMFFCPDARILSSAGGEISYRLPWTSVAAFPGLFQQLEERRQHMGIGGYGISSTTMEEVFLRSAHLATLPEKQQAAIVAAAQQSGSNISDASMGSDDKEADERVGTSRKNTLTGAGTRPASNSVSRRPSNASSPSEASLSPSKKDASAAPNLSSLSIDGMSEWSGGNDSSLVTSTRLHATAYTQFRACMIKRFICAKRDLAGRFFEVVLPVAVIALVLLILRMNQPPQGRELLFKAELYSDPQGINPVTPLWVSEYTPSLEPGTLYSLRNARGHPEGQSMFDVVVQHDLSNSMEVTDRLLETAHSHMGHRYGALLLNDTLFSHFNSTGSYDEYHTNEIKPALTLLHNTTFFHSLPVLVAEVAQARWNANRWRAQGGTFKGDVSQVSYQLHNHPLPMTGIQSLKTQTYLTLFAALFMLIPFCYLPASFVLFVVRERSVKSKHLQFVSGLQPWVYWAATFAYDLMQYCIIIVAVMGVMLAYQSHQFVGTAESFGATTLLLLLYGLSSIPLCYCYSWCFGNYTSAQVGIAGLNFLTGFLLVIASFMLDQLSTTKAANLQLKNVYRVFPTYNLGEGLIQISTREFQALLHGQAKPSPFDWDVAGRNMMCMAVEAVAYLVLTLALESNFLARAVRMLFDWSGELADPGPDVVQDEDEDVAEERKRVQKMRVQVVHTDSKGTRTLGLASPITPGSKKHEHDHGEGGQYKPPSWGVSLNDASQSSNADAVITSPYRDNANGSVTTVTIGSFNSPGEGLRSPLLGFAERQASAASPSSVHTPAWPTLTTSPREMELTPPTPADEHKDSVAALPSIHEHAGYPSSSDHVEEDVLVLQHVRKVYPARGGGKVTVAVDNLSLGIPRGEVFGFLGINGAGKTTTMKMMTGDIPMSKGRAYVNGYSVVKQLPEVRKEIGYCPQFDPLIDLMTSREQLTLYARLHGLPEPSIPGVVQELLNTLGLSRFADKQCGSYSGGNKRKLSLAMALIGNPSVVFLDEPSTGMDPVSRRFMWSVIESISDGRSVVLTTHSMEECEALCSRIGIMAAGRLQCLGSIQHLKSRFGRGYLMEINAHESRSREVSAFVRRLYPQSAMEQAHGGRLKVRLPQQGITLSSVFSTMEQHKKALQITDYSISQCSLETIFIDKVAKHDKQHEDE